MFQGRPSRVLFVSTPNRFLVGLFLRNISNENLGIMLKQATNRKEKTGVEGTAREFEVDE